MSAEAAFAAGVIAHLRADSSVLDYLGPTGRIYDRAPSGAAFPFLTLGRGETEPIDAADTDLIDHRLTVHVFGRRDDRDLIRNSLGAVRQSLHGTNLDLDAPYACCLCRVVYSDIFVGPDARTLHGVMRVRGILGT